MKFVDNFLNVEYVECIGDICSIVYSSRFSFAQ